MLEGGKGAINGWIKRKQNPTQEPCHYFQHKSNPFQLYFILIFFTLKSIWSPLLNATA